MSLDPTKGFHIPVIMGNPYHKANDSVTLKFESAKEQTGEEFAELRKFKNQLGWLVFKTNEMTDEDIPKEEAQKGDAPMSVQIRKRLYVYWQQCGRPGAAGMDDKLKAEMFYRNECQKFLDSISKKIDEVNQPPY